MRYGKKGFSLIELMVVMAIILLIAAIALPNMVRAIMMANEASAVESLRTVAAASIEYYSSYGGYPTNLSQLGPSGGTVAYPGAADLIDARLVTGIKHGYSFTWTTGPSDAYGHTVNYSLTARPLYPGITGQRTFYVDSTGIIRTEISNVATESSSPIG